MFPPYGAQMQPSATPTPQQQQNMPNGMQYGGPMGGYGGGMGNMPMMPQPAVQQMPQPAQAPMRGGGFTPPPTEQLQQGMVRGLFGLPGRR